MQKPALSEADHAKVSAEIRAAEAKTAGEIYVVVSHASDELAAVPVVWAAVAALLAAWVLNLLTPLSTTWVLAVQAIIFVALALLLSWTELRRYVVPGRLKTEAAHHSAERLFLAHGIHLTDLRTGVLLFVSLAERRVEVIADEGIHAKVDPHTWENVVQKVTVAAKAGSLADGLADGVRIIGDVLAAHYPPASQNRNELPDRVLEL